MTNKQIELTTGNVTATITKQCLDGPSEDVRKSDAPMSDRIAAQFQYLILKTRQHDPLLSAAQALLKVTQSPAGQVLGNWRCGALAHCTLEEFVKASDPDVLTYQIHRGWHDGVGTPGQDDLRKFEGVGKQDRADDNTPPREHPAERDEALAGLRELIDAAFKKLHDSSGPGLSRDEILLRVLMTSEGKAAAARITALSPAT